MRKVLKITTLLVALLITAIYVVYERETLDDNADDLRLTRPVITLYGRASDTAYLFSDYNDPGAFYVIENSDPLCSRRRLVREKTGVVDTRVAGTYFVTYSADDEHGNPLAPQTRTVQVVPSEAGFLNGVYNVMYTGTITSQVGKTTTVVGTYTALVKTNGSNKCFDIYTLNLGTESLAVSGCVNNDSLQLDLWTPDYAKIQAQGKLSASRDTFTVQTLVYPYSPNSVYRFKNIFSRQLIIAASS